MALAYPALFYNAVNGDRIYDADSFERLLKKFFTSGVFAGDMAVTAGAGMTVSVAPGYANTDGKVIFFDDPTVLDIAVAHSTLRRIDNIVVERNDTDRDITLKVVTGTPAASPVGPEPVRENGIYQLILARVTVPAGATSITNAMITDTRVPQDGEDPVLCGIVADSMGIVDYSGLYDTFRGQFEEWFADLQDELSGDVAANLQRQINELEQDVSDNTSGIASNAERIASNTQSISDLNTAKGDKALWINMGTISSLPVTKTVSGVTTDMVCAHAELGTPSAQTGDWTIDTDTAGRITVSGKISGSTTLKILLVPGTNK